MKYLYKCHMGGHTFEDEYWGDLHCETCGGVDRYIRQIKDSEDLFNWIVEYLAENRKNISIEIFLEDIRDELQDNEMFAETLDKLQKFTIDVLDNVIDFKEGAK